MKKCPYCKTLMNDDVSMCPNCLKDMSNVIEMPDVNVIGKNKPNNMFIYSGVLALGGLVAAISQRFNKINFQEKYQSKLIEIENLIDTSNKQELVNEALEYLNLANNCAFREIFFYIIACVGVVLFGVTLFIKIRNKLKKKEK